MVRNGDFLLNDDDDDDKDDDEDHDNNTNQDEHKDYHEQDIFSSIEFFAEKPLSGGLEISGRRVDR